MRVTVRPARPLPLCQGEATGWCENLRPWGADKRDLAGHRLFSAVMDIGYSNARNVCAMRESAGDGGRRTAAHPFPARKPFT